ncbi:MAG: acetyl/propionyl/methylcrotonyl-CoA carboxylase subunit alpha [Gammaproteobacteria bacterium]|nr:acetyl/propionyl/methylcrotonyl-CoA carboxylase subunit alpha [Gammaproteobacteria bacterium]
MFNKILIANRGEIAVRVARSARALGVRSVAVYSSADENALHVEACDEAFCIGGAAASESYLNAARILEVAQLCGAEAIHPGYGFLSENAAFARDCEAAGIVFIGPPASAIDAMGSKSEAKALMEKAGVPLVPGYHDDDQADDLLSQESERIGYPQLIKASAGGGGKGMRLVENAADFSQALVSARREASASFGDDKVLIERYLTKPRHVEMQIFADAEGNCVHLFERDCSIQRRHQKVLEEAPAPGISAELRERMGSAATDCARAIHYVGAGTVEFLLDEDGSFYFMEMNTRLQVEHPVSEMITGQDLVEWQLRVASGESLPLAQAEIDCRGHAIEARIYAETPRNDFMPAAGRISYLSLPQRQAGVRVDTGVRRGDQIGINYDPMIAKLIVHANDRDAALAKLENALRQYQILGLNTNIGFLISLLSMPEFGAADFDTGFIGKHHDRLFAQDPRHLREATVLAAAALLPAFEQPEAGDSLHSAWESRDLWRMNLSARYVIELERDGETLAVRVERASDGWRLMLDDDVFMLDGGWIDSDHMRLQMNGQRLELPLLREPDSITLNHQGQAFRFTLPDHRHAGDSDAADADHPQAPMSGAVVALPVAVGDTVEPGDTLIVIEAMKMEHAIVAQVSGSVGEILFAVGDQVDEGDTLVLLEVE